MGSRSRSSTVRRCAWSCLATSAPAVSSGSSGSRSARGPGRGTSSTSPIGCCRRTKSRVRARGCRSAWSRSTPTCCLSDVLSPANGETVAAGPVEVRGYAFAGGERHVTRVDVSVDGGASWSQAELLGDLGQWAWRLWRMTVDLAPGEHEILVRAWDSSAATQPEDEAALWNPKGYVNNARPRVRVRARG